MAVYTPVSEAQLVQFLTEYELGALISFKGIETGVSNTNYHVETETGRYILTLFEPHRVDANDIPAFITYSSTLAANGVPCPQTLVRRDGQTLSSLNQRPAALFSFLEGEGQSSASINPQKCFAAGATLAQMHLAAGAMHVTPSNHFGLRGWETWLQQIGPRMDMISPGLYDLARSEFDAIRSGWPDDVPRGAIHADFFPDNVFFIGNDVSGVIDFHFVCDDAFVYDLAIAANAWTFDADNTFNDKRFAQLLAGYKSVRPLSESETLSLTLLLRAGALRFLLSRLEEKLKWQPGDFMVPHDPLVFAARLRHWGQHGQG